MHLFYTPGLKDRNYTLDEQESKHCIKVLRLEQGFKIHLIDGQGNFYEAEISEPNPKRCILKILKKDEEFNKRNYRLHIAIAPTKNIDRYEWFLEKATEIGIDEITPLLCDHSERKVIKPERLEKILVSAMKQSYKAYLPKLNPLTRYSDFVKSEPKGIRMIAHCEEGVKLSITEQIKPGSEVCILIGPEGDFSAKEIELAKENKFQELSLGSSRLRTETAGVIACHSVYFLNEQL